MTDWVMRPAVPADEPCLVSMWLKSYAHSSEVARAGFVGASKDASEAELAYWRVHQPIVTALLRLGTVRVICDAERVTYEPGHPAVIWAWSCTTPNRVHWLGVKRRIAAETELATELVDALVAAFVEHEAPLPRATFALMDLRRVKSARSAWEHDLTWLPPLRALSQRVAAHDAAFAGVGAFVLDTRREEWRPAT